MEPPIDLRVGQSTPLQVAARPEPTDECFRQAQASRDRFGIGFAHDFPVTPRWCGAAPT